MLTPQKASSYHFSLEKLAVTFSEHLITCFRYFDILAKTRSRVTTATTFPVKMTLVHAWALLSIEESRTRSRTRLKI